jgi:hypothetical protein
MTEILSSLNIALQRQQELPEIQTIFPDASSFLAVQAKYVPYNISTGPNW